MAERPGKFFRRNVQGQNGCCKSGDCEGVFSALERKAVIHEFDIRQWGIQAASALEFAEFKASRFWVYNFKAEHSIVSRKVSKFITPLQRESRPSLMDSISELRSDIRCHISNKTAALVFNTDQSGFNLEYHSGRTLAIKGSSSIECIAQSLSSLTHSYTIMPTVSASGCLVGKLLIVLKETKGVFGPIVLKTLFKPENVHLLASASGKMGKKEMIVYWQDVFFPVVAGQNVTMLLDSWPSFKDRQAIDSVKPVDVSLDILTIPPGGTPIAQPLDVYGFRVWKQFGRKIQDYVVLKQHDVVLYQRNNIIKLQSLIYHQLRSERFNGMFKYAWHKSGYIDEKPAFVSPLDFCFDVLKAGLDCDYCEEKRFLTCSWCKQNICFAHFFTSFHVCNVYDP
jgi:hypothetical protein